MSENYTGFQEVDEYELGWDDEIQKDSPEFLFLAEGDYDFEVIDFERSRYNPREGSKLPPCNMAIISIKIVTPQGISTIKHRLYLHSRTEGMLCAFFAGIGQRKKGEKQKMNWNLVPGSKGRCQVGVRKYKSNDGEDRKSNEIKKFYETSDKAVSAGQSSFKEGVF